MPLRYLLILLLLLLFPFAVSAQVQQVIPTGQTYQLTYQRGGYGADSVLGVPIRDTTATFPTFRLKGRFTLRPQDNKLYYHDGTKWTAIGSGTGGGSVNSVTASPPLYSSGGTDPNITIDTTVIHTSVYNDLRYIKISDTTAKWLTTIFEGYGINITGNPKQPVISVDTGEVATVNYVNNITWQHTMERGNSSTLNPTVTNSAPYYIANTTGVEGGIRFDSNGSKAGYVLYDHAGKSIRIGEGAGNKLVTISLINGGLSLGDGGTGDATSGITWDWNFPTEYIARLQRGDVDRFSVDTNGRVLTLGKDDYVYNINSTLTELSKAPKGYVDSLFNNIPSGGVASVSGTPPITSTGGANPAIGLDTTVVHTSPYNDARYLWRSDTANLVSTKADDEILQAQIDAIQPTDTTSLSNRINQKLNIVDTTGKWITDVYEDWGIDITGTSKQPVFAVDSTEVSTKADDIRIKQDLVDSMQIVRQLIADTPVYAHRILLEGQSNAYGTGTADSLLYPPISNIPFNFSQQFQRVFIADSNGRYHKLQFPLNNQGSDGFTKFGPEIGIAWKWTQNNPNGWLFIDKIYIDGGLINSFLNNSNYNAYMMNKRNGSNAWLDSAGFKPIESGWVWVQGEGNNGDSEATYRTKLDSLYRARLDSGMITIGTRVVISKVGVNSAAYGAGVAAAMDDFVLDNSHARALNNDDAHYDLDDVHYTSYWNLQLGSNAYAKIFDADSMKIDTSYQYIVNQREYLQEGDIRIKGYGVIKAGILTGLDSNAVPYPLPSIPDFIVPGIVATNGNDPNKVGGLSAYYADIPNGIWNYYSATADNSMIFRHNGTGGTAYVFRNKTNSNIVTISQSLGLVTHIAPTWNPANAASIMMRRGTGGNGTEITSTLPASFVPDNVKYTDTLNRLVTTKKYVDSLFATGGGGGSTDWGDIGGTLSDQTDLQAALDGKVDENTAITGATKTKITYDAKGLVTAGADATTADIAPSTDRNYVTDAQQTVIGNTSGTNTGDNIFTASDFNTSGATVSIDYANGQAASGSVNGFLSSGNFTNFTAAYNDKINSAAFSAGQLTLTQQDAGTVTATINDATTAVKGIASYGASDFDVTSGAVAIDYTNGQAASTSTKGFLTSTDWNTFNGKQGALSLTTTGTSGAATLIGNTLNIPQYSGGGGGSSPFLWTQTGDAGPNNNAAETSVIGTVSGSTSITGGTITAAKTYKIEASGLYTTNGTLNDCVVRLKYGSTTIGTANLTAAANAALPISMTNQRWYIEAIVTFRTNGASGTVRVTGKLTFTTDGSGFGSQLPYEVPIDATSTTTVNTTGTNSFDITADWQAAASGRSFIGSNSLGLQYN